VSNNKLIYKIYKLILFNKVIKMPRVDLIKPFSVNLLTLLCKLDHFINISNIHGILLKGLAYKIELVNLHKKGL
jgi:hypothetical protein